MTGRRYLALAAALAFTCTPLATDAAHSSVDSKIQQQRQKQHAIHQQLQQKRGELGAARSRYMSATQQLQETNHNITVANNQLAWLQARMHSNQQRLAWNQVQLNAAQATLRRHTDALNRRLVDAYEHGQLSYLTVLFSATSFSDFVERWDDIRLLVSANEKALRERKAAEAKVSDVERDLIGTREQLSQNQAAAEQTQNQLTALAQERMQLVAAADAQKHEVAQEVTQLEEISEQTELEVEALIRQKQAEEAARNAAARRAALLSGQQPPPLVGAPGMLSWPVSGRISSPFGMRSNPISGRFLMHTGIDIAAEMGTTVVAPADGRVISAGWNSGGYGNMIIIDNGGPMSTLFGHLSQIFVANDQEVKRGQAIGAVGSTGESTGPHLHFEVRIDGKPVDPMSYLH
ncbi:MAG: murein hydrolase activator EnvC family protein [Vulcanimicrobiaceae bacterium]